MWSKVVTAALLAIALGSIIEARDFHNLRGRGSPALATDKVAKKEVLTTPKSKTKDKCHARPERCPETKRFYNDKTSGMYSLSTCHQILIVYFRILRWITSWCPVRPWWDLQRPHTYRLQQPVRISLLCFPAEVGRMLRRSYNLAQRRSRM